MKEKKNIDRLFQEQFKDFEAKPSKKVWAGIEASLKENNKRKPFIIPLWYKVAGVAAVVAILFMVGSAIMVNQNNSNPVVETDVNHTESGSDTNSSSEDFTNSQDNSNSNITESSDLETTNEKEKSSENTSNAVSERLEKLQKSQKNNTSPNTDSEQTFESITATSEDQNKSKNRTEDAVVKASQENKKISESVQGKNTSKTTAIVNAEKSSQKTDSNLLEAEGKSVVENKKSLLEEAQKNTEQQVTEESDIAKLTESKKWEVSPYAAPVYYGGFGGGSAIDPQFSDNDADGEVSLAYGVNFSYAINKRLKLRSGVTKVSHSYTTNDIAFSPTTNPSAIRAISQNRSDGLNVAIRDSNASKASGIPPSGVAGGSDIFGRTALPQFFEGSLNQTLGYIEVPVELEYALVNNRFGVNVFGGASTLFLDENRVSVVTGGNTNEIGEANNVNNVSFSTNLGFGFNYKITDSFKINLEPTFKYQVNSFSGSSNFNPYILGLYSGFSFRF